MGSAISILTRIYEQRDVPQGEMPVVGITSNTVPWELLRAAGLRPFLLSPLRAATPLADRYMESVFSVRMKAIFDLLLSAEGAVFCGVVVPRTSELEHKLYLYLREVKRQKAERAPPAILYNLLHARSAEAEAYGLERTRDLKLAAERLSGRRIEPGALQAAIAEGNAAREAIRGLLRQREGGAPKLSGVETLPLIGAWNFMDRAEYTLLAQNALREIETRPPIEGPRILIKGPPLDRVDFCTGIESYGAIVVAEDDWWGARAAGQDIDTAGDPVDAVFRKYYFDSPSPRVFPAATADAWFQARASTVDGVIFYLPQEDDVLGWDYPRLRDSLTQRAIPHVMVRDASSDAIAGFIERLKPASRA